MKPSKFDAVISYVDPSDKLWAKDYSNATGNYNISGPRFRSWGTLRYLFKAISENMPFVDRIILLVARESQVPIWVNTETVRIVKHIEFIPKEFLPTFNSCTIESFMYRISDLSEHFIYFNDDMFPLNLLHVGDFFTEDVPHIKFLFDDVYSAKNMYRCQCRSGMDMITSALNLSDYTLGKLIRVSHIPCPMLKFSLDKVGELCEDKIKKSATMLRMKKNVNQYIYAYYHYFTNNYIDDSASFIYTDIEDNLDSIEDIILNSSIQLACFNDSGNVNDYTNTSKNLRSIFERRFPNKCKYEV